MKFIFTVLSAFILFITLSSSYSLFDTDVNLFELKSKDFKHIVKFDRQTSQKEIEATLSLLRQYNSSIEIRKSVDVTTKKIAFEISSKSVKCKSDNFGAGIILIDNNNLCQCGISDNDID